MDNQKADLNAMIAKWTAQQNAPLAHGGGYANTVRPHPQAGPMAAGFASLFSLLNDENGLTAANSVRDLAHNVGFLNAYHKREDADHWKDMASEVHAMSEWAKRAKKTAGAARHDPRPEYKTREAYLTHMLKAFGEGERFIVAKLSYDGGEA